MTTIELAARLARRLKAREIDALSVPGAMDLVEAINAGLQECYQLLPPWQRRTTLSLELAAPLSVSLDLTNGSVALGDGGSLFADGLIGRSVVADGDPNWNEVQSETQLLDLYQGATGVHAATVYGDSVFSDFATFDGMVGHPRFADTRETLIPHNPRLEGRPAEIGKPRYYWFEPGANSLGSGVPVFFRVSPAPDRAYVLRCDIEFRPARLAYTSLHTPTAIALADQFLERALVPLCELRLLRSPEWADAALAQLVLADAAAAREFLGQQRPSPGVPCNRVGTPPGY